MTGFQSVTSWTSDKICFALAGEQMKCSECGRLNFVPLRSRGVICTRSVRYLKLQTLVKSSFMKRTVIHTPCVHHSRGWALLSSDGEAVPWTSTSLLRIPITSFEYLQENHGLYPRSSQFRWEVTWGFYLILRLAIGITKVLTTFEPL